MADIFKSYQFLNKALGLGLSDEQLMRQEKMFKVLLAEEQGFVLKEEEAVNFEAFTYMRPRNGFHARAIDPIRHPESFKSEYDSSED